MPKHSIGGQSRPVSQILRPSFLALMALAPLGCVAVPAKAAPIAAYPARAEGFTQSLNGDWKFKYLPALNAGTDAGFAAPSFDVAAWKTISVPSNWELKDFAEPSYGNTLKDGLGLYRSTFRVPANWKANRRVCLRFEGVAFGYDFWVNGTKIGASNASAFNPHTFDITDSLKDGENTLAVQVSTKPAGFEFDINDDWSLSGIYRDVTLFSIPLTHVQDLTARTKLVGGAAEIAVSAKVSGTGEVRGKLIAPDGKTASEFVLSRGESGMFAATVKVINPQLWTAETPSLYRLQLALSANGQTLQTLEERIGLREISVKDGVLMLNGRPIKLRGVNHHDLSLTNGRAVTEAEMRRDLELMKQGNVNFIRTSHYAPQPRFIELCDEMGFYVMDEVAMGRGDMHMTDPTFLPQMLARTEATVTRDKNRASVIVWSIGNENPFNDAEIVAGDLAKTLDPTRPICMPKTGGKFGKDYLKFPKDVDIFAPHYPTNETMRAWTTRLKRPTIFTEYAHALGLATERIHDQWEIIQATPNFAGGAIWHFHDQGLLRTSAEPVDQSKKTNFVWLDKNRYYDTGGLDGADGLVYSDRTPQVDFWEMRKVYSPVQIAGDSTVVGAGASEIALTVENRYDFRALSGMKLVWALERNGAEIQTGDIPLRAPSHESESVKVPVNIPAGAMGDVLALEVRCLDETGRAITEHSERLGMAGANRAAWLQALPTVGQAKVSESTSEIKIENSRWVLKVARPSGELSIRDRAGRVLVAGIYPHPGRKLLMVEGPKGERAGFWNASTLTKLQEPKIEVTHKGDTVSLSVSGRYARPKSKEEAEALIGGYTLQISQSGALTINYDYTLAKGKLAEAGLSLVLPSEMTEFRWEGQGPYPGYPGKDQLNEFGLFHLNRDDLRFEGNRRATSVALLTSAKGVGVALVTSSADVAVERSGNKTLLSHNAAISSLGNKLGAPETVVRAENTPRITGSFTLVPLNETWPTALTQRFGPPSAAREVFHPFYHSYDQ